MNKISMEFLTPAIFHHNNYERCNWQIAHFAHSTSIRHVRNYKSESIIQNQELKWKFQHAISNEPMSVIENRQ